MNLTHLFIVFDLIEFSDIRFYCKCNVICVLSNKCIFYFKHLHRKIVICLLNLRFCNRLWSHFTALTDFFFSWIYIFSLHFCVRQWDLKKKTTKNVIFVLLKLFLCILNCSVLLFPPLNSYRRFLIHKLCEKFLSLGSFSISQGYDRRVVIYSRKNTHCIGNIQATKTSTFNERWISK